jgi:hypothetical protein
MSFKNTRFEDVNVNSQCESSSVGAIMLHCGDDFCVDLFPDF